MAKIKRIDLTKTQMVKESDDQTMHIDEFDLLEAKIDPKDLRTQKKIIRLKEDIEQEKSKIRCKLFHKYAFQPNDPLKIGP